VNTWPTNATDPSGLQICTGSGIDSYLQQIGVTKYTKKKVNSRYLYSGDGAQWKKGDYESEIVARMIGSDRTFSLAYQVNTKEGNIAALKKHVQARFKVLNAAQAKRYKFGAGDNFKVNSDYWYYDKSAGVIRPVGGEKRKEAAIKHVLKHGEDYAIACYFASWLCMSSGGPFTRDNNVAPNDWIPGDWGYITNDAFVKGKTPEGYEGENVIYVQNDRWWGHISATQTYLPLTGANSWQKMVQGWNGGKAPISHFRDRPTAGLQVLDVRTSQYPTASSGTANRSN
jgi:hypothetical protein